MSIPLVTITFVRATSFTIYENSKRFIGGLFRHPLYSPPRPPRHQFEPHIDTIPPYHGFFGLNASVAFLAGCVSGACLTVMACPFEFTKLATQIELLVRRQSYAPFGEVPVSMEAKTPLQMAREIYMGQGVRGFYSGFGYHLGNHPPSPLPYPQLPF
jgi:solute carrier family 25 (mitochondrial carnitine/acylcarnitine transporter), member 20/29